MGLVRFSPRLSKAHLHAVMSMKSQLQLQMPGLVADDPIATRNHQLRESLAVHSARVRKTSVEKKVGALNWSNKLQTGAFSTQIFSRLKVVREFEYGSNPLCAGRMRMSGRMGDICAELERMANHAQS